MTEKLVALGMTVAGLIGLHFGVEFSGWVLTVGLLLAVFA